MIDAALATARLRWFARGSVANVIVAEKAAAIGGLRFGEYLKIGVPVALLTTLAGALILVALH